MYLAGFKVLGENVDEIINILGKKWRTTSDITKENKNIDSTMMFDTNMYTTIFNDMLIMCREEYCVRINSTLMITTIIKLVSSKEVQLEMISGGGSSEWGFDFGLESKETKKIYLDILSLCKEHQWNIVDIYPEGLLEKTLDEKIINLKTKVLHLFKEDN